MSAAQAQIDALGADFDAALATRRTSDTGAREQALQQMHATIAALAALADSGISEIDSEFARAVAQQCRDLMEDERIMRSPAQCLCGKDIPPGYGRLSCDSCLSAAHDAARQCAHCSVMIGDAVWGTDEDGEVACGNCMDRLKRPCEYCPAPYGPNPVVVDGVTMCQRCAGKYMAKCALCGVGVNVEDEQSTRCCADECGAALCPRHRRWTRQLLVVCSEKHAGCEGAVPCGFPGCTHPVMGPGGDDPGESAGPPVRDAQCNHRADHVVLCDMHDEDDDDVVYLPGVCPRAKCRSASAATACVAQKAMRPKSDGVKKKPRK